MKAIRLFFVVGCTLSLSPAMTSAVTIIECVDASGATTFTSSCPPGTTKKGTKKLRGLGGTNDPTIADIAKDHPITLYAIKNCDACVSVRDQLKARDIPFDEINVSGNQDRYDKLIELTGGEATVPVLTLDEKVLSGHNRSALDHALTDAGYP